MATYKVTVDESFIPTLVELAQQNGEIAQCQVCHCEEPATGWAEDGVGFYLCSQACADEYDKEDN